MQILKLKFRQTSPPGFLVTLTCNQQLWEIEGCLSLIPTELTASWQDWQIIYSQLAAIRSCLTSPSKLRIIPKSVLVGSTSESTQAVKTNLNRWLNSADSEWQSIRDSLISFANQFPQEEIQIIIDAQELNLCRLPWQEWDLLTQYYPQTEVAISMSKVKDITNATKYTAIESKKVRILLVVGSSDGINTQSDLEVVRQLEAKKVEIVCLLQPSLKELCNSLWCDRGYHIFIFTGHSRSNENGEIGWIEINETESITIAEFKEAFKQAINKGLQLAIFNSCDGLGLANQLNELNLRRIIVMQEPVPDEIAVEFLEHFFTEFIANQSLFTSVCKARKKLEHFNSRYPGAVWLPTLCLKPSVNCLTWRSLLKPDSISNQDVLKPRTKLAQLIKIVATVILCLLTFVLGLSLNLILPEINSKLISHYVNFDSDLEFPQGTWQYGGSTTWKPIRELVDDKLQHKYPHFQLIYTRHPTLANGSGTGIKMLLDGQISFAQSSRNIEDKEYDEAIIRGKILKQVPVGIDGIAVVVNAKLAIKKLTIKQLQSIYTGKINNWSQLGGQDLAIIPYARPPQSGTTEFFRADVLNNKSFGKNVVFIEEPKVVLQQISDANNLGGIYFVSVSEVINNCSVKILAIARRPGSNFISLNKEPGSCKLERDRLNIEVLHNGEYPLIRRLFVIIEANSPVDEEVGEAYKNFMLSKEGQSLIAKSGFIPLRSF